MQEAYQRQREVIATAYENLLLSPVLLGLARTFRSKCGHCGTANDVMIAARILLSIYVTSEVARALRHA
jgi:hypothetical protein